jgi:cobalamin synthase
MSSPRSRRAVRRSRTDPGLAAVAAAGAVACAATVAAMRGLGGRTGDTLGATIALTELAATLVMLGFVPR